MLTVEMLRNAYAVKNHRVCRLSDRQVQQIVDRWSGSGLPASNIVGAMELHEKWLPKFVHVMVYDDSATYLVEDTVENRALIRAAMAEQGADGLQPRPDFCGVEFEAVDGNPIYEYNKASWPDTHELEQLLKTCETYKRDYCEDPVIYYSLNLDW